MQISIYFLFISNISLSNSLDLRTYVTYNLKLLFFYQLQVVKYYFKITLYHWILFLNEHLCYPQPEVIYTQANKPLCDATCSRLLQALTLQLKILHTVFFYSNTRRASGALRGTNPFNFSSHWENAPCLTITQEGSLHPSKPTQCPAAGALKL